MQFWIGLVVGILIGWLIEWVIDWLFWRRTAAAALAAEAELRRALQSAQNEIEELRRQLAESDHTAETPAPTSESTDRSTAEANITNPE